MVPLTLKFNESNPQLQRTIAAELGVRTNLKTQEGKLMNVYWLSTGVNGGYSSYDELKHRKIIAQGWSALNDLRTLCNIADSNFDLFRDVINHIGDQEYKDQHGNLENWWISDKTHGYCANSMWYLFKEMKPGDLVIAKDGRTVKGFCEVTKKGSDSYEYDCRDVYEYAQTVSFPVEWIDWQTQTVFSFTPTPPAKMRGVMHVQNAYQQIIYEWQAYLANNKKGQK